MITCLFFQLHSHHHLAFAYLAALSLERGGLAGFELALSVCITNAKCVEHLL